MSRWGKITDAGLSVLRFLVTQTGPVSRAAVVKATGIAAKNIAGVIERLVESGHVREIPREKTTRNYAALVEITPAGRAECGPSVVLSEPAQKALRYLREHEGDAERPSYRKIQEATGATNNVITTLRARKLVHPARLVLTDYGRKVADGEVAIETQTHGPKLSERKAVVEDKPAPVVAIPAALTGYRGIKHPPIPGPAERPQGVTPRAWEVRTTPEHSPLHNACARGLW